MSAAVRLYQVRWQEEDADQLQADQPHYHNEMQKGTNPDDPIGQQTSAPTEKQEQQDGLSAQLSWRGPPSIFYIFAILEFVDWLLKYWMKSFE